jgi:signal-transduction protein with cAMP-binding, CBS, and nucleotidyltransferase domain
MHVQTKIFSRRVKELMHAPRVSVSKGTPCEDIIPHMAERRAQCCVISDSHGKLAGILRISDILDRVVFKVGPQTLVDDVMDSKVQTIDENEYLYHAIGRMRRHDVQEIVVINEAVQPVGIIYIKDAIEAASAHITEQIDRLSAEGDIESLRGVKAAQVELAHDMFEDNIAASQIQQLLSHVNNDIYNRIISDTIRNMKAEGWGMPPVEFCAIVMGSGGRGENYLYPDQDNGFILEDYPDEDHNRVDQYFRELSQRMCDGLNEVGFPYCKGNVMASNPLWRKTYSQWLEQVKLWGRKRNSVALRLADIFFDFQPVWGKRQLADDLRADVLRILQKNHFFISEMLASQQDRGVALGMFNRLVPEKGEGKRGAVDLKYRGTLPLVEAIRLMALKQGLAETSTLERIRKLHVAGILSDTEADYLTTAFLFITKLLLKWQVDEYEGRQPVTRFVKIRRLSRREKENLTNAFRHIEAFRKRLKGELTGDVF